MAHSKKFFFNFLKGERQRGFPEWWKKKGQADNWAVVQMKREGWKSPGRMRKKNKQTQWNWPKSSFRFFPKILQKNSIEFFRLTQYYCIRRLFSALSKSLRIICMCVCTGVQYMQTYSLNISNNQMRQWPINFRKSRGECLKGRDGNIVRKPLENF